MWLVPRPESVFCCIPGPAAKATVANSNNTPKAESEFDDFVVGYAVDFGIFAFLNKAAANK